MNSCKKKSRQKKYVNIYVLLSDRIKNLREKIARKRTTHFEHSTFIYNVINEIVAQCKKERQKDTFKNVLNNTIFFLFSTCKFNNSDTT